MPVAEYSWESITIDFITYLRKSKGYEMKMVMVDRSSKYDTFMLATTGCTAKDAAQLFFKNVVKN